MTFRFVASGRLCPQTKFLADLLKRLLLSLEWVGRSPAFINESSDDLLAQLVMLSAAEEVLYAIVLASRNRLMNAELAILAILS